MKYKQTISYLYEQLPMFHRIGAAAYKADLNNTHAICSILGHPENKFRSIHVAGTNGKGSSSHMLASILQSAGYKTGLYTSPHLKDFRERIRINGKPVPKQKVVRFVERYRSEFEAVAPSFFEWTVGLAFDHFAAEQVDIAVIEVGLGGRLDSTNVITPLASLITNISFDHTALLGNTLQKIAAEKAGIIKPGVPVVVSQTQAGIKKVFQQKAKKNKAPLLFADQVYHPVKISYLPEKNRCAYTYSHKGSKITVQCDLTGTYQVQNIAGVMAIINVLNDVLPVKKRALERGLKQVIDVTGLHGRWEVIGKTPRVICDTAHNEDGIREVVRCMNREFRSGMARGKLHVVFGVVSDKDVSSVFRLLRKDLHFRGATYYFCKPDIPRGMDANRLREAAHGFGLTGAAYETVRRAAAAARKAAAPGEVVFVGGSNFTVAEVL